MRVRDEGGGGRRRGGGRTNHFTVSGVRHNLVCLGALMKQVKLRASSYGLNKALVPRMLLDGSVGHGDC